MKILSIVIIALLVIGGVFLFFQWEGMPRVLSNTLSKKLGVPSSVEKIGLTPSTISIQKVTVGNPPGSILSKAFSSEMIRIEAPLTRYLEDSIVIEEITIDTVYLGLEFESPTGTSGNWTTIMGNLKKESNAPSSGKNRSVLIKKLVLTNISVDLIYQSGDRKVKKLRPIPRLEFTNVTSEGGIPTEQIMNSVLGQMLRSVFEKENLKGLMDKALQLTPPQYQQFIEPFKGLFN